MMKKIAGVLVGCAPLSAFAVAPATIADLTTGIDFSTVGLGILAVAAAVIVVAIVKKGAVMVVHAVKSM